MANDYFSGLNKYVTKLNNIELYDNKLDVNLIDDSSISTHVTAGDLNTIKDTLSTLVDNVNDINSHLISASFGDSSGYGISSNSNSSIDNYLTDDFVRKNQLIVDNHTINDSIIKFDDYYLRHKNIFVDGYKISPTSPYNLVSYNQLSLTINGLTANFDSFLADIKQQITTYLNGSSIQLHHNDLWGYYSEIDLEADENKSKTINIDGQDVTVTWNTTSSCFTYNNGTQVLQPIYHLGSIYYRYYVENGSISTATYSADGNRVIDITDPLSAILSSTRGRYNHLWFTIDGVSSILENDIGIAYNLLLYEKISPPVQNYARWLNGEYDYGVRLIGQGCKVFNKVDILDPAYREYKWFRIYAKNNLPIIQNVSTFFDPKYIGREVFGNDFPISTSVQNGSIPTNFISNDDKDWKVYTYGTDNYDLPFYDIHLFDAGVGQNGVDKNEHETGFNNGWMECGGQQRVYAEVKAGEDGGLYVFFSPSTILFPIPFATNQPLDIQVTLKRDINQPFPGIVPVSVNKEDTYFFDIIGGGQGLSAGTKGYFYVKWYVTGRYQMNNIEPTYYYTVNKYNKLHDMYWINNHETNGHITISNSDPLAYFSSDEALQDAIVHTIAGNIFDKMINLLIRYMETSDRDPDFSDDPTGRYHFTYTNPTTNVKTEWYVDKDSIVLHMLNKTQISDNIGVLTIYIPEIGITPSAYNIPLKQLNGWNDDGAGTTIIEKLKYIAAARLRTNSIMNYVIDRIENDSYRRYYDKSEWELTENYGNINFKWNKADIYKYDYCNNSAVSSDYFYLTSFIDLPPSLLAENITKHVDRDQYSPLSSQEWSEYYRVDNYPPPEKKYDSDLYRLRSDIFKDPFYSSTGVHPIPSTKY